MVVPELVAGEAFTKLRYDRQIGGRRDARAALAVFGMIAAAPDLFKIREMPDQSYRHADEVLANYVDQASSYVDAILLPTADDELIRALTLDPTRSYQAPRRPLTCPRRRCRGAVGGPGRPHRSPTPSRPPPARGTCPPPSQFSTDKPGTRPK